MRGGKGRRAVDCGFPGITGTEGRLRGGRWDPTRKGRLPWCFVDISNSSRSGWAAPKHRARIAPSKAGSGAAVGPRFAQHYPAEVADIPTPRTKWSMTAGIPLWYKCHASRVEDAASYQQNHTGGLRLAFFGDSIVETLRGTSLCRAVPRCKGVSASRKRVANRRFDRGERLPADRLHATSFSHSCAQRLHKQTCALFRWTRV